MVANAVLDPLVALDANEDPQPYLLESFSHNDTFDEWTLTLRPGLKFHNGEAVTSEHVVRVFDALIESPITRGGLVSVVDVTAKDELSTVLTMNYPWSAFPASLLTQAGYLPLLGEDLKPVADTPIGTGPFTWKDKVGDVVSVERNASYWQKGTNGEQLPYLDGIDFRPIPDSESRVNALLTGDINSLIITNPPAQQRLVEAAQAGQIQFWTDRGTRENSFIMMNAAKERPLSDARLRRAIGYATDKAAYRNLSNIPEELGTDEKFQKESRWFSENPEYPTFNLDTAKELVRSWSADNGGASPTLSLLGSDDPASLRQTQVLQEQWSQAGFEVNIASAAEGSQIFQVVGGDYDVVLWRQFGASDPDADSHFWSDANMGVPGSINLNMAQYSNKVVNDALLAARTTDDFAFRKAQYDKVQAEWAKDGPYVWVAFSRKTVAGSTAVRSLRNNPLPDGSASAPFTVGAFRMTETWLER
jgi:peptide/nickel transport system substrate-binding protein